MSNYTTTVRTSKRKDGSIIKTNCVIVDTNKMTEGEWKIVGTLVSNGYKIIEKKEKKATGKGWTTEKMREYLTENNKEGLKEFELKIKNKENFMKITGWFRTEFLNKK